MTAYVNRRPSSKTQIAHAERLVVRYRVTPTQWQAMVVIPNLGPESLATAKRHVAQLKKDGKKGVEIHRFTPTVFNSAGQ